LHFFAFFCWFTPPPADAALPRWGENLRSLIPSTGSALGGGEPRSGGGGTPFVPLGHFPVGQNLNPPPAGAALPRWGENLCSLIPSIGSALGGGGPLAVVGVPPSSRLDTSPWGGQNLNPPPAGAALPRWGRTYVRWRRTPPLGGGEPVFADTEYWFRPWGRGTTKWWWGLQIINIMFYPY